MKLIKITYGIFTIVLFIILFAEYLFPIPFDSLNSDLGRHLLLGKIIFTEGRVPTVNLLSYTYPDYPFINTHWLSEVIFYLWHSVFGFNGLIILSVMLIATTFSFIFFYSVRKFDFFTTILISLIFMQVMAGRVQVRPELFSFLYLSIFIVILYKYRDKYTRWIFTIIPLQLFWVNSHIYFFTGVIVLSLFLIDALISRKDAVRSKKFLTLFFVTIAAGLTTLCNPNFIRGALYPFFVLNDYGMTIKENLNYFTALKVSQAPRLTYFAVALALLWINISIAIKKMKPIDFLLSGFFTFMALFAIRNFPLFVIGAFIPGVKATAYLMHLILGHFKKRKVFLINVCLFILVFSAVIPSIAWNIRVHKFGLGVIDNAGEAVDFLLRNNIKGKIYNNFDIGDYLAYRLYPQEKVYIDSRPEAYSKKFLQKTYKPSLAMPSIFTQEDKKYDFNVIFLDHTESTRETKQFLYWITRNKEWKMVYLNSVVVIFLKDNPSNQLVIKKYAMNHNYVRIKASDFNDKEKAAELINFFAKVGWEDQLLKVAIRFLDFEFDPENCPVLGYVAKSLQKQQSTMAQIYVNKYIKFCK